MDNHPHIVSIAVQLVPVQSGDKHPYEWIDEVIAIIKASGVAYEVGPFSTTIESDYKSITRLIDNINSFLLSKNCPEWLLNIQMQIRTGEDITSSEKVDKHRS